MLDTAIKQLIGKVKEFVKYWVCEIIAVEEDTAEYQRKRRGLYGAADEND